MIITDKVSKSNLGRLQIPTLKGHVKIITRDAKTGRIDQVAEGDNIVTNAVRDILANDYLGDVDPTNITPLWRKWYGGILLYASAHDNLDPDDYYIRSNYSQYLIGHAGHDNPDDLEDDWSRGFYNTALEQRTSNSIKQVWEWNAQCGQLSVNSLSLCNETLGNAGRGLNTFNYAYTKAFKSFCPLEIISSRPATFTANMISDQNVVAMIDDTHGLWYEMGDYGEYQNMNSYFETSSVTIYIKKMAYLKTGLQDFAKVNDEYTTHFTVDLGSTILVQPSYAFLNGQLWLFHNITGRDSISSQLQWDALNINYWVIDIENQTIVDSGTYHNNSADWGPVCIEGRGWYRALAPVSVGSRCMFTNIPYAYDYTRSFEWYFPICSPNAHEQNPAPQFNVTGFRAYSPQYGMTTIMCTTEDTIFNFQGSMSSDTYPSVIVMPGAVQFADRFAICDPGPFWVDNREVYITKACNWLFSTPYKPSSYVMPIGTGISWGNAPRYLVANKFLNTTKFNLPSPITKTGDQNMTIEYTLTEI